MINFIIGVTIKGINTTDSNNKDNNDGNNNDDNNDDDNNGNDDDGVINLINDDNDKHSMNISNIKECQRIIRDRIGIKENSQM